MKYKDYYKILGLETSRVSIDEIKTAYRLAAKKYHPDLNVGDNLAEERIKDINEAYRILSTPASKRKYDRVWNSKNNVKNYQKIKGKNIFNMFFYTSFNIRRLTYILFVCLSIFKTVNARHGKIKSFNIYHAPLTIFFCRVFSTSENNIIS